jgi:hypothetical protein
LMRLTARIPAPLWVNVPAITRMLFDRVDRS